MLYPLHIVINISLSLHSFLNHVSVAAYYVDVHTFDFKCDVITLILNVMVIFLANLICLALCNTGH